MIASPFFSLRTPLILPCYIHAMCDTELQLEQMAASIGISVIHESRGKNWHQKQQKRFDEQARKLTWREEASIRRNLLSILLDTLDDMLQVVSKAVRAAKHVLHENTHISAAVQPHSHTEGLIVQEEGRAASERAASRIAASSCANECR